MARKCWFKSPLTSKFLMVTMFFRLPRRNLMTAAISVERLMDDARGRWRCEGVICASQTGFLVDVMKRILSKIDYISQIVSGKTCVTPGDQRETRGPLVSRASGSLKREETGSPASSSGTASRPRVGAALVRNSGEAVQRKSSMTRGTAAFPNCHPREGGDSGNTGAGGSSPRLSLSSRLSAGIQ